MADKTTLARPYAKAIFELARDRGDLAPWSRALHAAAGAVGHPDMQVVLHSPKVSNDDRVGLLGAVLRGDGQAWTGSVAELGENMLRLLSHNYRLNVLPQVAAIFDTLKAEAENTLDVTVSSAFEISDRARDRIAGALKRRFGRDVRISTETNPKLIGGAVIRAGDMVIDGSVRGRLDQLVGELNS